MPKDAVLPGECANLLAWLKKCADLRDIRKCTRTHDHILRRPLLGETVCIGNALVNAYAKCGALSEAQSVFEKLPNQNVISWTALISGYAQQGLGKEALGYFYRMQQNGVCPSVITFLCILRACGSIGAVMTGKEMHAQIVGQEMRKMENVVGTALLDMYTKCGSLANAQEVFNELSLRNVITWTALIAGYAEHGQTDEALSCFEQMHHEGLSPDAVTFACILKACYTVRKGEKIHLDVLKGDYFAKSAALGSAFVDMYAKSGSLEKAQEVFDTLPMQNVISWTALIAGYCEHGHEQEALDHFHQMQHSGVFPDAVTFASVLKACGNMRTTQKGKQIHTEIGRVLARNHIVLGNALVDMYARCGALTNARQAFNELMDPDIVSWNVLMAGYAMHGHCEEALNCFEQMQRDGISPGAVTFLSALKACSHIGAAERGEAMHVKIVRGGLLDENFMLGTALVDMYAKCGALAKAQQVFDGLPFQDLISWNALITGYAQLGRPNIVFSSFDRMVRDGITPDVVTFTALVNACSYSGLVDKGQTYFDIMSANYGIVPTLDLYSCMVNLFAYAGHLDKAITTIKDMPYTDYLSIWIAVLGGCQKSGNVSLGRLAFQQALDLNEKCAAAYVFMSKIYAASVEVGF